MPLFASEIGRASAMPIKSMRRFLTDEEIWPIGYDARIRRPGQPAWPPMWQYRSVNGSWEKVGALEEFLDPTTPEELIRALGTAHGEYLQRRVERERRGAPDGTPAGQRRCWGNMAWRLNDAWPILYWSLIDYYLEPKIAYDFLRRAYAPALLTFERTPDDLNVWVINDSTMAIAGELVVQRLSLDGSIRGEIRAAVRVGPAQSARCIDTVPLGPISLRHECLRAQLGPLSATYLLVGERYLDLPEAQLSVQRDGRSLRISTDVFARQVTLDTDEYGYLFEDNHFDLAPGETREVAILFPDVADASSVHVSCLNGKDNNPKERL